MHKILFILFTFLISQISIANSIIGKGLFCSKISNTDRYEKYIAIHILDKKRIDVWTYPENSLKEEMHNYEIEGLTIYFIPNFVLKGEKIFHDMSHCIREVLQYSSLGNVHCAIK